MRSGDPIPDRILNAPQIRFGLMLYLEAFFDLDSERVPGMALGRIPWIAIQRYAEHYELDEEQTECLFYFIRAMDTAHLKRAEQKNG